MNKLLADIPLSPLGGYKGLGPLGTVSDAPGQFTSLLSTIIGVMTVISAIWFTFIFISGGIGILTSGGEKGAIESAQKRITTGILGLFIVIAAVFIVNLIGNLLGLPNILNIGELINTIKV